MTKRWTEQVTNFFCNNIKGNVMQKIIGLYGAHDSGKTETLNWIIELCNQSINGGNLPPPKVIPQRWSDRWSAFGYKGKLIAIATGGDDASAIQMNCAFFLAVKCDIAISATRTWGQTRGALNFFAAQQGLNVTYIRKTYAGNSAQYYPVNFGQAQQIFANLP